MWGGRSGSCRQTHQKLHVPRDRFGLVTGRSGQPNSSHHCPVKGRTWRKREQPLKKLMASVDWWHQEQQWSEPKAVGETKRIILLEQEVKRLRMSGASPQLEPPATGGVRQ